MLMSRYLGIVMLSACGFTVNVGEDPSEPPTVAFEFDKSGADEQSGTIMVPVVLSHITDEPVSVAYTLLAGAGATAGVDFEIATGRLVFQPDDLRREVPVTIKDDADETEAVERFEIALSDAVGCELDQSHAIHEVEIADHVLPRISIGPAPTQSSETTPSQLILTLTKPSEGQSTVVIGVAGAMPAAANANDLTLLDGTMIVIPDGATTVNVPIGEQNDQLDEEDIEYVELSLRGPSTNLVLGMSRSLTHGILDDDLPPVVGFPNPPTASINEPGNTTTRQIEVRLSAPSGRTVEVDFGDDPNDSADGNDASIFLLTGNTLKFDPGETSKDITIFFGADSTDEDDEQQITVLSNIKNAMPGNLMHTYTIVDNDTAAVSFTSSTSSVDEASPGGVSITVVLDRQSTKTVHVPFSISGSAESDDYDLLTSSPLVFNPGQTQTSIQLDIPANPGNEPDDTVQIDLGTPTMGGAKLGSRTRHTLTIKD